MEDALETFDVSEDELCALVHKLMPTWRDDRLDEFEYLSGGYSNFNVVFRRRHKTPDASGEHDSRYVLRLPKREQPYVDRQAEAAWYGRLPNAIGPIPLALDVHSGQMITPWITGDLLVDVFPGSCCEADLVAYLQAMHAQLPDVAKHYHVPTLVPEFIGLDWPADLDRSKFMTGVQSSASSSDVAVTCHNDLNPWNILVTPEGWQTLDWEFVGRNDPLFDLVALHQGLQLNISTLPALATAFLPSCSSQRLTRAFAHFWLREWCWASYQLRRGNRRKEIVEQESEAKQQLLVLPEF